MIHILTHFITNLYILCKQLFSFNKFKVLYWPGVNDPTHRGVSELDVTKRIDGCEHEKADVPGCSMLQFVQRSERYRADSIEEVDIKNQPLKRINKRLNRLNLAKNICYSFSSAKKQT